MRDIIENSNFYYKRMVLIELKYLFNNNIIPVAKKISQ